MFLKCLNIGNDRHTRREKSTLTLSTINVLVCLGDTNNIGQYLIIHQSRICSVEEHMKKTIPCEKGFSMMLKK